MGTARTLIGVGSFGTCWILWIDFSRSYRDGDGTVDRGAITVILPRYRYHGYAAGHPNLGTTYTTGDGVVVEAWSGTTLSYARNPQKLFTPEGIQNFKYGVAHEFGHHLGLPDRYDFGEGQNLKQCRVEHPHSKSSREGLYSLMVTLKPRPFPKLAPLSPWDYWRLQWVFGESSPFVPVVDLLGEGGLQGLVLPDLFSSQGVVYRVPFPSLESTAFHRNPFSWQPISGTPPPSPGLFRVREGCWSSSLLGPLCSGGGQWKNIPPQTIFWR